VTFYTQQIVVKNNSHYTLKISVLIVAAAVGVGAEVVVVGGDKACTVSAPLKFVTHTYK
jgi:hypothetical protein